MGVFSRIGDKKNTEVGGKKFPVGEKEKKNSKSWIERKSSLSQMEKKGYSVQVWNSCWRHRKQKSWYFGSAHAERQSIKMFYGYGFGKPCSLMNSDIHVHEKGRLNQFDSVPRILSQIQDLVEYLHIYYE